MGRQTVVGNQSTRELFYQWLESTISYTVSIDGTTNVGTIANVTVDGQAAPYEVSWGDSSPVQFGTTTHTYPAKNDQYLVSVVAFHEGAELEGSTLINRVSGQVTNGSVSETRFIQIAVYRQIDLDETVRWFDAEKLTAITPAPPLDTLRTTPSQRPRERSVFSQQFNFVEGSLEIHKGASAVTIFNKTGAMTVDGRPIPTGSTFSIPPLVTTTYPKITLDYTSPTGDSDIWVWRKSL